MGVVCSIRGERVSKPSDVRLAPQSDLPYNHDYWDHVNAAASLAIYRELERADNNETFFKRLSREHSVSFESGELPRALIDFKSFARDYPEKLFALLDKIRSDMAETFIEYYVVDKSQSFLAHYRGQIQARTFEVLRLVEHAVGSQIILGSQPTQIRLRPILVRAGLEKTPYGSLASMIYWYARCKDYARVARACGAPNPAIRPIFRTAITQLLASKDIEQAAVGAYLRSLTYHASLSKAGLGKAHKKRLLRIKNVQFAAPAMHVEDNTFISIGNANALGDSPWYMLELHDHFDLAVEKTMEQFLPVIRKHAERYFKKVSAQIFAPLDKNGNLALGYIFARCSREAMARMLLRIRGVSEAAATYTENGDVIDFITVPNADVQKLIKKYAKPSREPKVGDFVKILSGEAKDYCGTITKTGVATVRFLTDRVFTVRLAPGSAKVLRVPKSKRAFWGQVI
jgi:transcription antitermination factor NusG